MRLSIEIRTLLIGMILLLAGVSPHADETTGQVQLPLDVYSTLIEQARSETRPAPAGFAVGNAGITVNTSRVDGTVNGTVSVTLSIDVFEDEWVLIPILPAGTPVGSVTVGGQTVQLIPTTHGLAWATEKSGSHEMRLAYRVDGAVSDGGVTMAIPVPTAASTRLSATLPGANLDVAVIPGAGTRSTTSGDTTTVQATIPATQGIQISWRAPADRDHVISRASYAGRLTGDALSWTADLDVELFTDDSVTLNLLPGAATLVDLQVDGKTASILLEDATFATTVRGRGVHRVRIDFQVPVVREGGSPRVDLSIPSIPVSRFELELPGKKEISFSPTAAVAAKFTEQTTVAVAHVPMTQRVSISWSEAIPADILAETRSNASIYHLAHAEEGVLYVHAIVQNDVTRGETSMIELLLPDDVQINRIESATGIVADWRLTETDDAGRRVSVFLDRQLQGELLFDVYYDQSLGTNQASETSVPMIRMADAQRQRGMIALLADNELTLDPVQALNLTRIGENRLPDFVRAAVNLTVAHAFKYAEDTPTLSVQAVPPKPVQGRFDAQIDTLISLGDVTMLGSTSIEINVKSGKIMSVDLELPADVSLLNLTAPSLRTHELDVDDPRKVKIEFTQEMEGQFRVELTYERITRDGDAAVEVDTVSVPGAEVEQGRIAVEALSAVEVRPAVAEQLTVLEVNELPRRLVLRTTHPILLAYKYVTAVPAHRLALEVTRHPVVGVQEAAIDRADYRTLFTVDGLQVTTARFMVRNSRKQFLRIDLPEGSEVWSVFVAGKAEKPALARGETDTEGESILIKILNSTQGFPVDIVYATTTPGLSSFGKIRGSLPRPDVLVTHTHWDAYLPDDLLLARPSTNLDVIESGRRVSGGELGVELETLERAAAVHKTGPLRMTVPASGVHFAFDKLYANQTEHESRFAVAYISSVGAGAGKFAGLVGTALLWVGLGLTIRKKPRAAAAVALAGLAIVYVTFGIFNLSAKPALLLSAVAGVVFLAVQWSRGFAVAEWRRTAKT